MSRVDAVVECPVHDSFRVQQVAGLFDLTLKDRVTEIFSVEVPELLPQKSSDDWQIGMIIGPSGSGKTTIAKHAFGDAVYAPPMWNSQQALIDGFGKISIHQATSLLTSVGLSSPPSWIKPFHVLSNGEQFRANLARALAEQMQGDDSSSLLVFDEFTSVVDRTVAKIGSHAVSRLLRRDFPNLKLVAVTCHYDVVEWLEPDWVIDMSSQTLSRRRLRRPTIRLEITRCKHEAWGMFARHHYLSNSLSPYAECFLATLDDRPVGFIAVLNSIGRKRMKRISRVVVLPDFQGIGIGSKLTKTIGERMFSQGNRVRITTSHPAMIRYLQHSSDWKIHTIKTLGHTRSQGSRESPSSSAGRAVIGAEFCNK